MLDATQVEELICIVSAMDRDSVIDKLLTLRAGFPVDFTAAFLDRTPLDRLRHILIALCMQTSQLPVDEVAAGV